MSNINIPPGPLIPPSANFSTMSVSEAEIGQIYPLGPIQQEIVTTCNSLALSQDGTTLAVGNNTGVGSVSIYVNINSVWTLQAGPFVGSGSVGSSQQGTSIAISANGNVVVTGGSGDNSNVGALWVFVRNGSTWSQQAKLVASNTVGSSYLGYSVSISGSGSVIVAGGYQDNSGVGAAFVWVNTGNTWSQTAKLIGSGAIGSANQGISVSISGDGNTIIVGGYEDNSSVGAAWTFFYNGSTWSQQAKLVGTGMVGSYSYQGTSVSTDLTGNIALSTGPYDNSEVGALWVFNRNGSTWTQTQKLIGTGFTLADPYEGYTGAIISQDGQTILLSGYYDNDENGAFWIFKLVNNQWVQQGSKILNNINTVQSYLFSATMACNYDASIIAIGSNMGLYFYNYI